MVRIPPEGRALRGWVGQRNLGFDSVVCPWRVSPLGLLCERRWWEVQTHSLDDLLQFKQSVSCGLWAFVHNPSFLSCSLGISCHLRLSKANTCNDCWSRPLPSPEGFLLFPASSVFPSLLNHLPSAYTYTLIFYSLSHPKKKRSLSWPYFPSSSSLKTILITPQLHLNCCLLKSPVPSTVVKLNDHDSFISTTQQDSADPSFFLETLFFFWLPWHYILLIIPQGLLC